MFVRPDLNPIAFSLGPVKVHWYGLMYLFGFLAAWWVGRIRTRLAHVYWEPYEVGDLLFYVVLGVVLGGRIGYMLFYATPILIHNPLTLFRIWDGGMSFHGGLIGVIIAMGFYARRTGRHYFSVADFAAILVPIGLFCGRIGNFINGELWGRVTHVPWAMIYPKVGPQPRHPSELYEAFFEGIVLFTVLLLYNMKPRPRMATSALFLLLYGLIRFTLEFFRQPDPQLGFIAFGWMTMGQALSLPMIVVGMALLVFAYRSPVFNGPPVKRTTPVESKES